MQIAEGCARGGQAEVYLVPGWIDHPDEGEGPIPRGTPVAIKHVHKHSGGGAFKPPQTKAEFDRAGGRVG